MGLTQVNTDGVKDDAVTLAKQASGTDGQVITYDASGNPKAIGPGTDGQVLTSAGAGAEPAFEDAVSEGTQVKSTGESGGTKFLREDGDGTSSWQTLPASGAALTGSTNNTVCTVTGANAIQGESNVRIDSNGRLLVGATSANVIHNQSANAAGDSTTPLLYAEGTGDSKSLTIVSDNTNAWRGSVLGLGRTRGTSVGDNTIVADGDNVGQIVFPAADGTNIRHNCASIRADIDGTPGENDVPGRLVFSTTADGASLTTERMRIDKTGNVKITDGDLVIGTSGHGIDFSASGNETNKESELLADYETGWFTPTCSSSITLVSGDSRLWYVKIGQVVHISGGLRVNDGQSQAKLELSGLPFTHGTMGSNGSNKSTGPFTCWGWSALPSYMDDDRHTWWMVSGTDLYLRTRQSNGDWHYFYPSDNCFIHLNFTYHTDS